MQPHPNSPDTAGSSDPANIDGEPQAAKIAGARSAAIARGDSSPAGTESAQGDPFDEASLGLVAGAPPAAAPSAAGAAEGGAPGVPPPASPKTGHARKGFSEDHAPSAVASATPGLASALADHTGMQPAQAPAGLDQAGPAADADAQANAGRDAAPTPADAAPAAPPQAAAQIGHALAAIHTGADGSSQVRILLNPAELGSVQVSITRTHDGMSSVSVAVERPETLHTLQTDLGHLHQALDRAGLPDQRSVTLHLAVADTGQGGPAGGQNGFGGGNGAAWGGSQHGREGAPDGRQYGQATPTVGDTGQIDSEPRWAAAAWQRAGVNITA